MNLHVGTESTAADSAVLEPRLGQKVVEQLGAEGRWRGSGEARTQAAAGIGGEGELRHQQQAAVDVLEGKVHLALRVAEDPIVEQLVQELVGMLRGVAGFHRDQHQQAL
ncbi:hypothetical protein COLO4_00546, partial [Corchorus olitorius]